MAAEPVHDPILGAVIQDKRRDLWLTTLSIRRGHTIEIRLLDGPKTLKIARPLVPWLREHDEQARHFAADRLLDLHNEVCNEGKPMTRAAFVKRLRLVSAAVFGEGCTLCYRDKCQVWEHTVTVFVNKRKKFENAETAPMLQKPESRIDVKPFPRLTLFDGTWTGTITLPSWRGFSSRLGPYGSASSKKASDGSAHINVAAPNGKGPPSREQADAVRYLLKHDERIRDAMLQEILAAYPAMRREYGCSKEDSAELMPEIENAADLKGLLGVSTVHVLNTSRNDIAYVGFEFGCTWDEEHGLGVMMHQDRVVEMGGADTSFLEWIAEKDKKRK